MKERFTPQMYLDWYVKQVSGCL